ncbi:putative integral membrane protein [Rosellinia necatrix]|uniref:Putative integral membrane protein n=1 Tax=Rosellinia necatrix TaxID=77044 RepID=A0A1S7ULX1_ROSNE|nr:putative integral membrane protein [Rosellinia necatrix]
MAGPSSPSPEYLAWMLARPDDTRAPGLIAACAVALAVATTSVALRLLSRRLQRSPLRLVASDQLAVAAWFFFVATCVLVSLSTRYGAGRHSVFVSDPRLLIITYVVAENTYAVVVALLKLSVLSLYRSIFAHTKWFCTLTWVMSGFVVALAAQTIISSDLQCIPLGRLWDLTLPGTCINYSLQALIAYIQNILIDIVLLTMPIPLVRKLHLDKRKKLGVILVFAAGASTCIVNTVQLVYIRQISGNADGSWTIVAPALLAVVECTTAFVATSVATWGPLYRMISGGPKVSDAERAYESTHFAPERRTRDGYTTHISTSKGPSGIPVDYAHGITVTNRIELARHHRDGGNWIQIED